MTSIPGLIVDPSTQPVADLVPRTLTPERWRLINARFKDYAQVDVLTLNVEAAQEMVRELRQCVADLLSGAQWTDDAPAPVPALPSAPMSDKLLDAVVASATTSGKLAECVVALGDQVVSLSKN